MRHVAPLRLRRAGWVAAMVLAPVPLAAWQVEAGLVDSVPAGARLVRVGPGGAMERLLRLQPLFAGDSVTLFTARARARLRLYPDTVHWVCGANAEPPCPTGFRVPAPRRRGGTVAALAELVRQSLAGLFSGEAWSRSVTAAARGDGELALPMLGLDSRIAAGRRPIVVAWTGGVPPYEVRLVRDGAGELASASAVRDRRAALGPLDLQPGLHAVQVRDSAGRTRLTRFQVVPGDSMPRVVLPATSLSEGSKALLAAVGLAGQEQGRWAWEAYLQLSVLSDETARLVQDQLAAGRLPPVPRP